MFNGFRVANRFIFHHSIYEILVYSHMLFSSFVISTDFSLSFHLLSLFSCFSLSNDFSSGLVSFDRPHERAAP